MADACEASPDGLTFIRTAATSVSREQLHRRNVPLLCTPQCIHTGEKATSCDVSGGVRHAWLLALLLLTAQFGCEQTEKSTDAAESSEQPDPSAKKKRKKNSGKTDSDKKDSGENSPPPKSSAADAPADAGTSEDDGWAALEGVVHKFTVRAPAGTQVLKHENADRLDGKTEAGSFGCYVHQSVSQYAKPKDMGQAVREFATMGYSMKPSWQEEVDGNFFGQLDKVKGAAVPDDISVKAIITTDQPKSLRMSCSGTVDHAETLRKMVKSLKYTP